MMRIVAGILTICVSVMATNTMGDIRNVKIKPLAAGEDFLIHQYRGFVPPLPEPDVSIIRAGIVISHTNLKTGEMKCLISTGEYSMGTVLGERYVSRIVGMMQDDSKMILLIFRAQARPGGGYANAHVVPADAGNYYVAVYSKASGDSIYSTSFTRDQGPAGEVPSETTEQGLVKMTDGGFEIFGTQFQFTADGRVERKD